MIISEKRLLQFVVTIGCIVPLAAGFSGMVYGDEILSGNNVNLDSHFRYLSGLLFGIGIGFLSTVPNIEKHKARFGLLAFIVVIGGSARLLGVILNGRPDNIMIAALAMELLVTPLLCLWQRRIAR